MAMLEVRALTKRFGGLAAVSDVDLEVAEREIRGVIGPNGAGKTTLFNVISGVYAPTSGSIRFEGREITGLRPSEIANLGVVRTFQRNAMFADMSVFENVVLARHVRAKQSLLGAVLGTGARRERANVARALEIIDFVGLGGLKDELARNLAHGHQRMLGIANALAVEPRLLMLDEPVAGMNPAESQAMIGHVRELRDRWGVAVILVEHDMRTVMELCETITVLNFGQKLAEGRPHEIVRNNDVIEAYLGSDDSSPDRPAPGVASGPAHAASLAKGA